MVTSKIYIYADKGRLRLEWFYQSQKYYLYLGLPDSKINRKNTLKSPLLIELEADLEVGCFDKSLKKYKSFLQAKGNIPEALSVVGLYQKWIDSKKGLDNTTMKKYQGSLKEVSIFFQGILVTEVSPSVCLGFWEWIQLKSGRPTTYNRKLEKLQACWDWGKSQGIIDVENLWQKIKKIPEKRIEVHPFSLEEIDLILTGFKSHPVGKDLTLFVEFLFKTGVRIGEACGVRWGDITLTNDINIATQLTDGERKLPKTGRTRTFKLPKSISDKLNKLRLSINPELSALIFTFKGKSIDARYFRRNIWQPILKGIGVEYRKPYNTRHTFISHALQKGINPVVVANITGHDTETLFKYYAGIISRSEIPELFF
jgi:integrase